MGLAKYLRVAAGVKGAGIHLMDEGSAQDSEIYAC